MRSVAVLFALAASAFAFSVTEPTNSTGWTTSGPNKVSWTSVSTDAQNFTIVLSNQSKFPPTQQVLDALVDTNADKSTVTVNPPSGGWQAGTGYQVNLVKDAENLSTILAQSEQFTIAASSSSTFSSATSGSVTASAGSGTLTVPAAPTKSTGASAGSTGTDSTGALNPTSSDTSTSPGNNGAAQSMGMQAGLFAGLAFLGAFLA